MLKDKNHINTGELLDEVLMTEPRFTLSEDFADALTEKISRRFTWGLYFKEFLIYLGVIVGIAAVFATTTFLLNEGSWKNWLSVLTTNAWLIIGVNILVIFVLFLDRVLLRYFMFQSTGEEI